MNTVSKPPIAYTLGEPAGIGADIILQLAQSQPLTDIVCIGEPELLSQRAATLGLQIDFLTAEQVVTAAAQLRVHSISLPNKVNAAEPNPDNARAVLATLDEAISGCLNGRYSAMVTGPIHKGVINQAGIAFSGHTEYLAQATNTPLPVMLLANGNLKVALMTTHLPLSEVSATITGERVRAVCRIVHEDLQSRFGIKNPRILVCGLNPHAGEGGHLGREEIEIIEPAIRQLQKAGLSIRGPLPADTVFTPAYIAESDVIVAMYHDQGLPVLKSHGFGEAANITLGLPIIRTSVDHGTAFDLAGSGKAHTGSLQTAITMARQLAG